MTKFSGIVGFKSDQVESEPGVWTETYTERHMTGSVIRAATAVTSDSVINSDIKMNNSISVIGDQFSFENFSNIRYIIYMGQKWSVDNVQIQRPRIILEIGSVMNA